VSLDLERALARAQEIARAAGALLREGWRRGFTVEHKGEVDLVTEHDRRSEALVVGELARAYPDHAVIAEEGSALHEGEEGARPTWLVDPLDGTTNYAHRLPFYAVSIALEQGGRPLVGVVHLPELGWEFCATAGGGARLNGERIGVSSTAELASALLATGFPYDRRTARDINLSEFEAALRRAQGIRRIGVASLDCALVAWGALDGYWEFKLKPWDIAAGALLVLEAGGRVTDLAGGPYRSSRGELLATNGRIHEELSTLLCRSRSGAAPAGSAAKLPRPSDRSAP
jgi:myo-inositol-1(or 4)-monophosphatase